MALSRFPTAMPQNVEAVLRASAALRNIRDTTGPLAFRYLDAVQSGLENAKTTFLRAMGEAKKAPPAAEAFMVGVNGPATLTEYQKGFEAIGAAATDWNARLATVLTKIPAAELIALGTRVETGTRHIEHAFEINAALADELRTSTELSTLIAAFEAVGG